MERRVKFKLFFSLFFLFFSFLFLWGKETPKLLDVKTEVEDKFIWIKIITDLPVEKYNSFTLSSPPRLVLDLYNTLHSNTQREALERPFPLKALRSSQFRKEPIRVTRVVLEFTQMPRYSISQELTEIRVKIDKRGEAKKPEKEKKEIEFKDVIIEKKEETVVIKLIASGRLGRYNAFLISNHKPWRVVVDFDNMRHRKATLRKAVDLPPIVSLRFSQFKLSPLIARLVIECSQKPQYQVSQAGNELKVEFQRILSEEEVVFIPSEEPETEEPKEELPQPVLPSEEAKVSRSPPEPEKRVDKILEEKPILPEEKKEKSEKELLVPTPAEIEIREVEKENPSPPEEKEEPPPPPEEEEEEIEPVIEIEGVIEEESPEEPKEEAVSPEEVEALPKPEVPEVPEVSEVPKKVEEEKLPVKALPRQVVEKKVKVPEVKFPKIKISLEITEAEIKNVLKIIAAKSGVNIIVGEGVTGVIPMLKLDNVPLEEAFKLVVKLGKLSYKYYPELNVVRVDKAEVFKAEAEQEALLKEIVPTDTKLFRINYATLEELLTPLQAILSKQGKIEKIPRLNAFLITDIPSRLEKIREIIKTLDIKTPQVMIESRIIEIKSVAVDRLGISWEAEVKEEDTSVTAIKGAPVEGNTVIQFGTIMDKVSLNAVLRYMESQQEIKIRSCPRIATVDNKTANIMVGHQIPYTTLDEAGNAVVRFINVGIQLSVTPHVTPDGHVCMDIVPEVSSTIPIGDQPVIGTTRAKTTIMVKDEETVVIGGLVRTHLTDIRDRVPGLSNLPFIGWLFKAKDNSGETSELLIFVTPYIIKD